MIKAVIETIKNNIPAAHEILSWQASESPLEILRGPPGVGGLYQDITIKVRIGYDPDRIIPPIDGC